MSEYFDQILNQAKQASFDMAKLTANDRSKILMNISGFLVAHKQEILQANQLDVDRAKQKNLSTRSRCRKNCSNGRPFKSRIRTMVELNKWTSVLESLRSDWSDWNYL